MNRKRSGISVGGFPAFALALALAMVSMTCVACGGSEQAAEAPQTPAAVTSTQGAQVAAAAPAQLAPAPVEAVVVDHRAVQERVAGEIVDKMDAGEFGAARRPFDEKMRSAISTDQLRQAWAPVAAQLGILRTHTVRSAQVKDGLEVLLVDCEMERGHVAVQVAFDDADRVVGLFLQPVK